MEHYETQKGMELADVLIDILPKLTEELRKVEEKKRMKQYTEQINKHELAAYVEYEIKNGARYVTHMDYNENTYLVIMEK